MNRNGVGYGELPYFRAPAVGRVRLSTEGAENQISELQQFGCDGHRSHAGTSRSRLGRRTSGLLRKGAGPSI